MILRRLHVQGFRSLRDLSIEFVHGLNVVKGPNEAGKSTLQGSIVALLFGDPGKKNREIEGMRSWGAETLPVLEGDLSPSNGNGSGKGEEKIWVLTKDFERRRAQLALEDGTVLGDRGKIAERLTEVLGVESPDVYTATGCLLQQQWAKVTAGTQMQELLQQSVTGGAEGTAVQDLLRKLDKAITGLELGTRGHPAKNPGPLAVASQRREKLEAQLATARGEAAAAEEARLQVEASQAQIAAIRGELAEAEGLAKRVEQYLKLERESGELREHLDGISATVETVQKLDSDIAVIEEGLAQGPAPAPQVAADVRNWRDKSVEREQDLEEARAKVAELEEQRRDLEAQVHRAQKEAEGLSAELERGRGLQTELQSAQAAQEEHRRRSEELAAQIEAGERHLAPRRPLLIVGVVVFLAGVALGLAVSAPLYAVAAVGVVLAGWGWSLRPPEGWETWPGEFAEAAKGVEEARRRAQRATDQLAHLLSVNRSETMEALAGEVATRQAASIEAKARLENCHVNLGEARKHVGQQEDVIRALRQRIKQAVAEAGFDSIEALVERVEARAGAERLLEANRKKREGALGSQTLEELAAKRRELTLRWNSLDEQLRSPEMLMARISPEEYQKLTLRLESLRTSLAEEEGRLREAEKIVAAARNDPDSVKALEGDLEQTQLEQQLLQDRLSVWTLAREVIGQARDETLATVTDRIGPRMGEYLAMLTGGRYSTVALDSQLRPSVTAPETGAEVAVGSEQQEAGLSCATREQVFLAARLALVEMLWPQGGPPLLLDDPLVNFDPGRRKSALTALQAAAGTHQVILFTCSHGYDEVADKLIEMPGPTEG
jgi:exonuclease SbcC